jgi:hypothetical protein
MAALWERDFLFNFRQQPDVRSFITEDRLGTSAPEFPLTGFSVLRDFSADWQTAELLNFAELLKDPHAHHDKEKQTRPSAENPHWHPQPIDFFQQFRLLVMHVRTCIVQKELFIFAHRKCPI